MLPKIILMAAEIFIWASLISLVVSILVYYKIGNVCSVLNAVCNICVNSVELSRGHVCDCDVFCALYVYIDQS